MQPDRTPITLVLAILAFDLVFGVVVLRDVFFSPSDPVHKKSEVVSAAASAVPQAEVKKSVSANSPTAATVPVDLKQPSAMKAPEEPVSKTQKNSDPLAPSGKSTQRNQATDVKMDRAQTLVAPVKSLRSDDFNLPTGDLRSGADAQPTGSLRNPSESNVTGSLRADEQTLPSGSLRPEERSLPTGSLR